MKKILFITVFIFIFMFFSCKKGNGGKNSSDTTGDNIKSTDNVETTFAVNTTKAVRGEINDFLELSGDIKTKTEISVYADTMGKLSSVTVKIGDYVAKDTIIAYVDPSKPGMQFALSPVKASISGTITSIPVQIGAVVTQQSPIATIGKLNEIEIITYISEKFISKMKRGLEAIIKTEAYPGTAFNGYVRELSPVVDPISRMLEVKIEVTSNVKLLKPGMFADLKIITQKKTNIVKIPAECMIKRYGSYYVFVVQKDEAGVSYVEQRNVVPGIQIENKVEIVEGLKADEEIVYRGQTLLEDKSKIKVVSTVQPITGKDKID